MPISRKHCRMKRIGLFGELRMAAVHRERVLRQIVRADREEIDFARERFGNQRGSGYFDHHADFDMVGAIAGLFQQKLFSGT